MKIYLFFILIVLYNCENIYEELTNETVTEEYCNNVIGNMTKLINETYIYLDYFKAPIQDKNNYATKIDIIKELNNIKTNNRNFYEFYRDIIDIIGKTNDGHFTFSYYPSEIINTPINLYYLCVPLRFEIIEEFGEDKVVPNNTYLTILYRPFYCPASYSNETIFKMRQLQNKKIVSINGLNPYDYLIKMSQNVASTHSEQSKYFFGLNNIYQRNLITFPYNEEDLPISIKFEGEELLDLNFTLLKRRIRTVEFNNFLLNEQIKSFKKNIPIPKFEEVEKKYKIQKGLLNSKEKRKIQLDEEEIEIEWDLEDSEGNIKCRVDEKNKLNVLFQRSFNPSSIGDYGDIMLDCFSKFYSNDYKLIIIESRNGGGAGALCIPFTYFVRPKISNPLISSTKKSQLLKSFFENDFGRINPEKCIPFSGADDLLNGDEDTYSDGINKIIHKKSKYFESMNIINKIQMEKKRKEYLSTGKTKKPTDIIIFTDGYSFSCASLFIRGIQVHGHGIVIGYNSRPDFNKSDFDASQSNSGVNTFDNIEYVQNLKKLGFQSRITFVELFDPNDKENPKIPMEFKKYPVDEISSIYVGYDDELYNRFISEAQRIFQKYNEHEECNPDNKYLYYETEECDSKINIKRAHGGYICGSDGKWDKNNCIAAYCDEGYYLNNERTECIQNPCDDITLNEIKINMEKKTEFIIQPNNLYIFTIDKENCTYEFSTELEYLMFIYINESGSTFNQVEKGKTFVYGDIIYINYYLNITENTTIIIIPETNETSDFDSSEQTSNEISDKSSDIPSDNNTFVRNYYKEKKSNKGLSTGIAVLIIVLLSLLLLSILAIIIIMRKKKNIINIENKQKTENNILVR